MTNSKSSHKILNFIITVLALWSIISIIIIVVWGTSPDLKGARACHADLKKLKEKYELERDTWTKDRFALEELVREGQTNQSLLLNQIDEVKHQLQILNQSLDSCHQQNDMLKDNITALNDEILIHEAIESNQTRNITQLQDLIELLQHNLTLAVIEYDACKISWKAAQGLQAAAEMQNQACQSSKQLLQKQLEKCNKLSSQTSTPNNDSPRTKSGLFLIGLLCIMCLLIL